ncbi:UDP-2,3-diacylglucosamine hydrolase [Aliifodinibius salipaludis]|uniref:UDP-2,3-diacylglucosamine hydrolase n=1 Tax=Fodinibius salipaludis TaxID=2032627 RepID=A0A2A2GEQ8_9BACT|nr:UDP-2,3-diacylglucosamine diphosphatase [Aliifodinibius salipaludis]PAU95407.1 UDP-2,3-diacylglucosamine hydrolase [Aliifodinibius salipaludis]
MKKRSVDIVVLSDLHLGTVGCHARELTQYLNSIEPQMLILNGDIFDMWNFKKYYWPKSHMRVIKCFLSMLANGTDIYYLTGNHDEVIRKISSLQIGPLFVKDKLLLELNGEKVWIFHGDILDITMKHTKWIAKIGGHGYDMLILLNRLINYMSKKMGYGKMSLSKKIKDNVKKAIKFIDDFEIAAIELAIQHEYDYVICGHIHQPKIRGYQNEEGSVIYMNSGDWIENLTALEYHQNEWSVYRYYDDKFIKRDATAELPIRKSIKKTSIIR